MLVDMPIMTSIWQEEIIRMAVLSVELHSLEEQLTLFTIVLALPIDSVTCKVGSVLPHLTKYSHIAELTIAFSFFGLFPYSSRLC
jgi:hypothetical protein